MKNASQEERDEARYNYWLVIREALKDIHELRFASDVRVAFIAEQVAQKLTDKAFASPLEIVR